MRSGFWFSVGLTALASIACSGGQSNSGGQSGTEGEVPYFRCAIPTAVPVGLDDELGRCGESGVGVTSPTRHTVRAFLNSISASRTTNMLWGPGDGSQPVNAAAVTLSLSGEPSTVVFRSNRDPSCPSSLEFSDARLRLQTSDGTFDEVATGRLEGELTEDAPIRFSGSLSLPFHGSYDSGPLTNYLEQPQFQVWHDEPSGSGVIRAEGQNFQSPELGHRIATVAWWSRQLNGLGAGGSGGGSSEPAADGYGDGGWANADREIRARAGSGGVRVDW